MRYGIPGQVKREPDGGDPRARSSSRREAIAASLVIDGRQVPVPEGGTLLDACRRDGIPPPSLCHTGGLTDVASAQNATSMDRAVLQAASSWLDGARITPALTNRIEAAIRAFDPCLPCATHAHGESWVAIRTVGPGGRVLDSGAWNHSRRRDEAPAALATGAPESTVRRRRYAGGAGGLSSTATRSFTAFTDLSIMACSSAFSLSSRIFSAPPAPMTTGTPT